jgi:hypothetical protein
MAWRSHGDLHRYSGQEPDGGPNRPGQCGGAASGGAAGRANAVAVLFTTVSVIRRFAVRNLLALDHAGVRVRRSGIRDLTAIMSGMRASVSDRPKAEREDQGNKEWREPVHHKQDRSFTLRQEAGFCTSLQPLSPNKGYHHSKVKPQG